MKPGFSLVLLLPLYAAPAPAFATVVPPCQSAQRAMHTQQEAAWMRQCIAAQRQASASADAENNCRRWLESCRRAPATRPGYMTF